MQKQNDDLCLMMSTPAFSFPGHEAPYFIFREWSTQDSKHSA